MKIYGVYKTIQTNDSDGWQHWTEDKLIRLFTEPYNAETFINELLIKEHDEWLNRIHLSDNLEYIRNTALMILNNEGVLLMVLIIGKVLKIVLHTLYTIQEMNVEECPSLTLSLSAD